jgi:hypothetical protein
MYFVAWLSMTLSFTLKPFLVSLSNYILYAAKLWENAVQFIMIQDKEAHAVVQRNKQEHPVRLRYMLPLFLSANTLKANTLAIMLSMSSSKIMLGPCGLTGGAAHSPHELSDATENGA